MRKYRSAPQPTRRPLTHLPAIRDAFDQNALARVCEMDEREFARYYGMNNYAVAQSVPDDFYHFRDNGQGVLAVAHLDTVGQPHERTARFVDTEDGPVVFSRALDDRLGAYIILELMPNLGVTFDVLLTVGEESGRSTASFFDGPRDYNWMIEFDRGGTDVVLYQYEDDITRDLVLDAGARVGEGIFSDISCLEHLECKGFNWGIGYQDYHGPRAHAFLDDTFEMVDRFLNFHEKNEDSYLPHEDGSPDIGGDRDYLWESLTRPGSSFHDMTEEEWSNYQDLDWSAG